MGRIERGHGLDPDQRAFDLRRLLGRDGDDPPFPRGARNTCLTTRRSAVSAIATWRPPRPTCAGFRTNCVIPVSRWTEMRQRRDRRRAGAAHVACVATRSAPAWSRITAHRALYIFNHFEYDSGTLKEEYDRDVAHPGRRSTCPRITTPTTTRPRHPLNRWRSHAHLLYGNWINEIYQSTPYDMEEIGH